MGALSVVLLLALTNPPRFVIEPPNCPPAWFESSSLESMLRADTSTGTRAYIAVLLPDCTKPADVEFTVLRPGQPPDVGRVALRDVPEAFRNRALALTIAERLITRPLSRPPRKPILINKAPPKPRIAQSRDWELGVHPIMVAGIPRADRYGGGVARLGFRPPIWSFGFGVEGLGGRQEASTGDARLWSLGLFADIARRFETDFIETSLGLAAGTGIVSLSGRDGSTSTSAVGGTLWVAAVLTTRWRLTPHWGIDVQPGLRYYLIGLEGTAGAERIIGLSGPAASVSIGLSWSS